MEGVTMNCSDCRAPLVRGYVFDSRYYEDGHPTDWVEGAPEYGIFGGLKTSKRRRLPIESWRCPNCGKLSMYAPEVTGN